MGREALSAALCWFAICGALAVNSLNDNVSAESASRLYRNLPAAGIYASRAPYGAYSFQVPLVTAPNAAASSHAPVKENFSFQNMNAHLKDSYGNRFVETKQSPQAVPFKPFPQQYVQLQELPAHFAQPLAAPSFTGFKQTPQIIVGSQYRLPLQHLQNASPNQFSFPHGIYAGNIKSLAPQMVSHSQFHGPLIRLPIPAQPYSQLQGQAHTHLPQSFHYGTKVIHNNQRPVSPSVVPTAQQQSSSNQATYADAQSEEQYHNDEPKFQRQQEASREVSSEEEKPEPVHQLVRHSDKLEQKVPIRETTITSFLNGKKTSVNLKTKPALPLLDISLLEPLTFDNPLVPQVQHFLPKISEAKYYKLPEITQNPDKKHQKPIQKTKTYDSGNDKVKPKKFVPRKKQRYPIVEVQNSYYDEIPSASTVRPVVTVKGTPNESPEFSYEINSPNYKETYKEKAINYNKETQSEPVHFTYGNQKHEEPVHYTYSHSSKEPIHIKEVHYEGKGEGPKHIVQKFNSVEHKEDDKQSQPEDSGETSEEDTPRYDQNENHHHHNDEHSIKHNNHHENHDNRYHDNHNQNHENHKNPQNLDNINHHHKNHNHHHKNHNHHHENQNQHNGDTHHHKSYNQHHDSPKQPHHQKPEHREEEYHHKPSSGHQNQNDDHHSFQPIKYYTKTSSGSFQPVSEYEEEIRIAAPIKVDPSQHIHPQSEPRQQAQPSPKPQLHINPSSEPHHNSAPRHNPGPYHNSASQHNSAPHHNLASHQKHHSPTAHVHEKTKSIIIQEEKPEQSDVGEHIKEMFDSEDSEKDFETAYKNSAFGFPAYDKSIDVEKDIYHPDSYGAPRDDFDVKHSPFQQFYDQSDSFPKSSRLSYKDAKDKMKEDYFLDYSVSKPESLTDHYKKKVDYYKLYKQQKPEKYITLGDGNEKKQKTNEKYTAIPYNFYPTQDLNMKQLLAQYKASPFVQEFDYSKGMPRDNSAHSTQPYHRYKSNTFFVEPQFQYGFEPLGLPRLLDSELATMASNHSPESESPGMRKKIYKENFYIKKTSMSDAGPNS